MNEVQHLCGMVVVFTVAVAADSIAAWGRHCQSSMQKQTAYGTHRKSKLVSLVFCSRSVWQSQTNFAVFSWARRPSFEFTQAIAFHRTGTSSVDYPNVSSKHACFLDPGCQSLGYPSVAVGHQSVTVIGQYLASCRFGTPPRLLMARLHRRQSGWLDAVAAARAQAGHCDKGMLGPSRALVPCPRVSSKLRDKKVKTMFSKFGGVSDMSLSLNGSYCLLAPDYRSVEAIHDSETRHSRFVLDHLDTLQHLQSKVHVRPWCAPVERTRTSEH